VNIEGKTRGYWKECKRDIGRKSKVNVDENAREVIGVKARGD